MSNSERQTKLTSSEIRDLVIQAGMQAIPHIGNPLATLYFGIKQQKRFRRLEAFYKEIAQELDSIKDRLAPIEEHDPEALAAIMEKLNETIEREQVRKKIEYLKAYFKNTLMNPVKADYDERSFFLDALSSMTLLECEVIKKLSSERLPVAVLTLVTTGGNEYATVGAIGRLKNLGFIEWVGANLGTPLEENVSLSDFGRRFHQFCLTFY